MRVCPNCGRESEHRFCPEDGWQTIVRPDQRSAPRRDRFVGMTIGGRYEISEPLARGSQAAVFKARHTQTGGICAVKLLLLEHMDDESLTKRFYLEARNTHRLHHPNSIRVYDFGQADDGILFIAMEYVDGIHLEELLENEERLSPARAVHITEQILRSLGEAHSHRLVHRDVKPRNIMLTDEFGVPDFVKVLDFGLSRALDGMGAGTVNAIGTPYCMAPEQWRVASVDARTDIYAVGCLMYEMLVGEAPFEPDDEATDVDALAWLQRAHLLEPPKNPLEIIPGACPGLLADLILDMLAKDPDERPQDVHAVLGRLEWIREQSPLPTSICG